MTEVSRPLIAGRVSHHLLRAQSVHNIIVAVDTMLYLVSEPKHDHGSRLPSAEEDGWCDRPAFEDRSTRAQQWLA